ncbi:MAG: dephospho-CoA kinase [Muribaculaceae bacterium]|nr:dephospho-CoA kinase [Muribaculaceae bacterium]
MKEGKVVALTGGIGAGKSVVSHVLRAMGFPVYDCDSEARRLMDSSPAMLARIAAEVAPSAITPDGRLDRARLAEIVFADPSALRKLNSIVHGAVRDHLAARIAESQAPIFFVETAILYESGIDRIVDAVWEVTAPAGERIDRVMARSGLTRSQVESRMAVQRVASAPTHRIIRNSSSDAILPQILHELRQLSA